MMYPIDANNNNHNNSIRLQSSQYNRLVQRNTQNFGIIIQKKQNYAIYIIICANKKKKIKKFKKYKIQNSKFDLAIYQVLLITSQRSCYS